MAWRSNNHNPTTCARLLRRNNNGLTASSMPPLNRLCWSARDVFGRVTDSYLTFSFRLDFYFGSRSRPMSSCPSWTIPVVELACKSNLRLGGRSEVVGNFAPPTQLLLPSSLFPLFPISAGNLTAWYKDHSTRHSPLLSLLHQLRRIFLYLPAFDFGLSLSLIYQSA